MADRQQGEQNKQVFVIMQVGELGSPERNRADQVYKYVIIPTLKAHNLEPYRADLDPTPGPITSQMIKTLIESPVVIADLTGRNPNVYYELGIAHSFDRPSILLCDTLSSLAFDTKDERTIPLGELTSQLSAEQAEEAKVLLTKALKKALSPDYRPSTPVTDAATSRSLDQLAVENPELTAIRDGIDELRTMIRRGPLVGPGMGTQADIEAMSTLIEQLVNQRHINPTYLESLKTTRTSDEFDKWIDRLRQKLVPDDPWSTTDSSTGFTDEPPF